MNYDQSRDEFKDRLDQEHSWPSWYLFKFIVPSSKESEVTALFPPENTTVKHSSKGNYRSVSVKIIMESSEEVMRIYEKAYQIEGVLAL